MRCATDSYPSGRFLMKKAHQRKDSPAQTMSSQTKIADTARRDERHGDRYRDRRRPIGKVDRHTAGVRTGHKSAVRKPVGRHVRVWRCCGHPLGDSRGRREAHSDSGARKGLRRGVRRRQVPNASVYTVTKSMLLLSNMTSISPPPRPYYLVFLARRFDPILKQPPRLWHSQVRTDSRL
jgi:hypothetical protein